MPKYMIERTVPGLGAKDSDELAAIAQKSVEVIETMSGRVQWIESFVTDDKFYCVYLADDVDAVAEHARRGGFPLDSVTTVHTMLDPTAAEAAA